jgi:hypothetical protein
MLVHAPPPHGSPLGGAASARLCRPRHVVLCRSHHRPRSVMCRLWRHHLTALCWTHVALSRPPVPDPMPSSRAPVPTLAPPSCAHLCQPWRRPLAPLCRPWRHPLTCPCAGLGRTSPPPHLSGSRVVNLAGE